MGRGGVVLRPQLGSAQQPHPLWLKFGPISSWADLEGAWLERRGRSTAWPCRVHYQPPPALDPWPVLGSCQLITANCKDWWWSLWPLSPGSQLLSCGGPWVWGGGRGGHAVRGPELEWGSSSQSPHLVARLPAVGRARPLCAPCRWVHWPGITGILGAPELPGTQGVKSGPLGRVCRVGRALRVCPALALVPPLPIL